MKPFVGPHKTPAAPDEKDVRIAELTAELEKARQEMRSFSHSVSHDLRAPLRAMEGFGRILIEDYAQALDEEGRRFLENIVANAQTMTSLLDDLLAYHRLTEKRPAKSEVDLSLLTQELLAALPKPGPVPEFKVHSLPTVLADPDLLRVAWEHLLANALKFSRKNPRPALEIGSNSSGPEKIFWIKDNGIGFDNQYAPKLFQVFQKLQKDPEFPGNGIGLAIVKRIVEKHGGRVWADAALDRGATFFIALPV